MPGGRSGWGCALVLAAGIAAASCSEKEAAPLKALTPAPLPTLPAQTAAQPSRDGGPSAQDVEAIHRVRPAPVLGSRAPGKAQRVSLSGVEARLGGRTFAVDRPEQARALVEALGDAPAVLVPDADTYLAQVNGLLAALDDAGTPTWLLHPDSAGDRAVAYPITLRDEEAFRAWLEEPKPGKIRVILRADGYELMTNVGKLAGGDPNGPTVPVRGGRLDVLGLREGMELLRGRFGDAKDACLVPTFGTDLAKVASSLSGFYRADGELIFPETCLIYPRPLPARPDAGAR